MNETEKMPEVKVIEYEFLPGRMAKCSEIDLMNLQDTAFSIQSFCTQQADKIKELEEENLELEKGNDTYQYLLELERNKCGKLEEERMVAISKVKTLSAKLQKEFQCMTQVDSLELYEQEYLCLIPEIIIFLDSLLSTQEKGSGNE